MEALPKKLNSQFKEATKTKTKIPASAVKNAIKAAAKFIKL